MAKDNKAVAILAYVLFGIIWYFVDKKEQTEFNKFHVKQGIVLLIGWIIWNVIVGILNGPIVFGFFGLLYLVPWIFVIIGIINSANGEKKELPIIGHFGSKLKL